MPYSVAAKNLMLNALRGAAPATPLTHVGLLDAASPLTAVTAVTSTDTFTKTAHGLVNADLVVLTEKTGGSGVTAGDGGNGNGAAYPYFVVAAAANTFQLSVLSGWTAVDIATDISTTTVTKLVELTGGTPAYARKAIAFNAAAAGSMDDTATLVFDVPAGAVVDYVSYYSALTAGTLLAISKIVSETFAVQGTYTLTDADLDLLGC